MSPGYPAYMSNKRSAQGVTARPEVAVGAVAVRDGRLLLVRRGRGVALGRWSLPGGRMEPGETLAAAVAREVAEETGLACEVGGLCGVAERRFPGAHYVILDYWVRLGDGEPVAGDDAAEVRWATAADLGRLELVDGLLEFLHDHGVTARLEP